MGDFSRDVKMLATLHEDDRSGQRLLDAARGLIGAFSDLLRIAEPGTTEVREICKKYFLLDFCLSLLSHHISVIKIE